MKLDFHDVEATLLIALWARAKFSREYPSIFNDEKAIALVDQLDYDFSANEAAWRLEGALVIVTRAAQLDNSYERISVSTRRRRSLISERASTPPFIASTMDQFDGMTSTCPTLSRQDGGCCQSLNAPHTSRRHCSTHSGAATSPTQATACFYPLGACLSGLTRHR